MDLVVDLLGKITWGKVHAIFNNGKEYDLTKEDHKKIEAILELSLIHI